MGKVRAYGYAKHKGDVVRVNERFEPGSKFWRTSAGNVHEDELEPYEPKYTGYFEPIPPTDDDTQGEDSVRFA